MRNPSSRSRGAPRRRLGRAAAPLALLAACAVAAALLPMAAAVAGKVDGKVDGQAVPAPPAEPATVTAAPGRYQVRCWQYGRLLFEQRDVELSGEQVAGLKLRGTDRQRQPMLLTDTGNATCLIKSTGAVAPAKR